MESADDAFSLAGDAQALVGRLFMKYPDDFKDLREARIVCVFSRDQPRLRGFPCEAFIGEPRVQGPFRPLFEFLVQQFCAPVLVEWEPEYLVVIDAALWAGLDARQRERLMFHELSHLQPKEDPETGEPRLDKDGRPQLQTGPHDVEVFTREIEEFSDAIPERLTPVANALVAGQRKLAGRRKRSA